MPSFCLLNTLSFSLFCLNILTTSTIILGLSLSQHALGERQGHALVHHRTNTNTFTPSGNLEFPIYLTCMGLEYRRELQDQTHMTTHKDASCYPLNPGLHIKVERPVVKALRLVCAGLQVDRG